MGTLLSSSCQLELGVQLSYLRLSCYKEHLQANYVSLQEQYVKLDHNREVGTMMTSKYYIP